MSLDPDYMDAESRRYGNDAVTLLRLTSGRIAVLTPRRDLFRIVDDVQEALRLGPAAHAAMAPLRTAPRDTTLGISLNNLNLSDLDL